ncbi:hypothetical protein [Streptomyces sp. ms115]|uniref:hypothetical protein n=1 Tax=Streptomyces sp. ms115 TaxID=1827928 RepID=UPI00117DC8A5|nr:hypothetical protein [Streptomyces sp. ms115]
MSVIHFPEYRAYEINRINASDAIMALLAGSRLAENMLRLTAGSTRLLPEIFPAVPHIKRMNLSTANAQSLLAEAEKHLSAMAVPYALAIHEDFVQTCFGLLIRSGQMTQAEADGAKAYSMHGLFERKVGHRLPQESMEQFHLIRKMRNAVIHAGGMPQSGLIGSATRLSNSALSQWIKITGAHPQVRISAGIPVSFSHGELILSLAVTKRISQEMNYLLRDKLARATWADVALEDFDIEHATLKHISQKKRKLPGFLNTNYRPLNLSQAELSSAIQRAGW